MWRCLGRELPRQSQVEALSREDMVTQGKGGLGSSSVRHWGPIFMVITRGQAFGVYRMNGGNWRLSENEEVGQWVGE